MGYLKRRVQSKDLERAQGWYGVAIVDGEQITDFLEKP
jgi:hypothetical protein